MSDISVNLYNSLIFNNFTVLLVFWLDVSFTVRFVFSIPDCVASCVLLSEWFSLSQHILQDNKSVCWLEMFIVYLVHIPVFNKFKVKVKFNPTI